MEPDDCNTCRWHDEQYFDSGWEFDYPTQDADCHCVCPHVSEEERETQHNDWCPEIDRYELEVMVKCKFYEPMEDLFHQGINPLFEIPTGGE